MKFYSEPNMGVYEFSRKMKDRHNPFKRRKLLFRFDANGEYTTKDAELIEKLKHRFKYEEEIKRADFCSDPFLKAFYAFVDDGKRPGDTEDATTHEETAVAPTPITYKCKKCDFTCGTPIELAHHSRKFHPKNGEDK